MQYIIGAVGALLFLGALGGAFWLGFRCGVDKSGPQRTAAPTKDVGAEAETTKRREEQLRKDFEVISGYNLSKALERRKT
jgi:hypothetical protein